MIRIKVKEILIERGLTQRDLAKLTEIREATLSQIVRGNVDKINLEYLEKIMFALELKDFNDVFEWK